MWLGEDRTDPEPTRAQSSPAGAAVAAPAAEALGGRHDRAPRRDAGAGAAGSVRGAVVASAPVPSGGAGGDAPGTLGGPWLADAGDPAPDHGSGLPRTSAGRTGRPGTELGGQRL